MDVGIVDALFMINQPPMGANIPVPQLFRALVDTGAQRTMITAAVAQTVGLTPIGKVGIQGIGGTVAYHNGYLFHVAFNFAAGPPQSLPSGQVQQQVVIFVQQAVVHGGELPSAVGFDVLLGMDVISTGSLHIEGNGTFSFSM